jgi:hypothetical protein
LPEDTSVDWWGNEKSTLKAFVLPKSQPFRGLDARFLLLSLLEELGKRKFVLSLPLSLNSMAKLM